MLVILGWAGALLAALSALLLLTSFRAVRLLHLALVAGTLLLALYGALRSDYPVLTLAGTGLVVGIVGLWRLLRRDRRGPRNDVTLACKSFARAQRAARDAFSAQL